MTLDKSIRQSLLDNLRNCLKACQNPLKSYLIKAISVVSSSTDDTTKRK
ncbi:hypothetical protein [Streptococcus agalactiae]|nr:hypothetical protein [Streptococcus agalactiae]